MDSLRDAPHLPGFKLLELIGAGASGRVYRAHRQGDLREVAVKILRTRPTRGRFEREVATLSALDHPNILRIEGHGEARGRVYLITELVQGTGLDRLLARRGLSRGALVRVIALVAEGLHYAHEADILHRDLKPANVIVDEAGAPHIVDFGLASFIGDVGRLTLPGAAIGTPMYMAPEVLVDGSTAGCPRSDVYALGIILYEALTGRHPFQAPTWEQIQHRVLAGVAPPMPGIPPWLRDVCLGMIARHPDERLDADQVVERMQRSPAEVEPTARDRPSGSGELSPHQPGDQVGPYRIEGLLGQGAMGAVYVGRHSQSNVRHAVKVVRSLEGNSRQRLEREARALAKVDRHPAIVGVHQFGILPGGQAYFALDFVEGTDLGVLLEEGPLPVERAVNTCAQIAEALAHVHEHGIVHRDVKPSNILLRREDGQALLTDFGLALDPEELRITAANALIGTPTYMAPEQALASKQVGSHSDVFALGAVLYQTLTGDPPFRGLHFVSVMRAIIHQDPDPPSALRPEVSRELSGVVLAALEKDPAERPNAAELAKALRSIQDGTPVELSSSSRAGLRRLRKRSRQALIFVLPVLLLLVSGGLATAWLSRRQSHSEWAMNVRGRVAAADATVLAFHSQCASGHLNPAAFEAEALERRRAELEELGGSLARLEADASARGDALVSLRAARVAATRALARCRVEKTLAQGDLTLARSQLNQLDIDDRTLLALVLRARERGASPAVLADAASSLTGIVRDEVLLLAAEGALHDGDLGMARGLVERVAKTTPLRRPRAWTAARVLSEEGLEAIARGELSQGLPLLEEAVRVDPEAGQAGFDASIPALLAGQQHRNRRELVASVDALVAAGGALPGAIAFYEDVAMATSKTHADKANLEVAVLVEKVLKLDPLHRLPPGLLTWLAFQAGEAYGKHLYREGLIMFVAVVRAGRVLGHSVNSVVVVEVYRSGVTAEFLRADPDDWAVRYWHGRALMNLAGIARSATPEERIEYAKQALKTLEPCLEQTLPVQARAEFHVRIFHAQAIAQPVGIVERIEAFLRANPDFPEEWRLLAIAGERADKSIPLERRLRIARRCVALIEERVRASREDRLTPDQRSENARRLDGPYSILLNLQIEAGQLDEVEAFLQSHKGKDVYQAPMRRVWRKRLANRAQELAAPE